MKRLLSSLMLLFMSVNLFAKGSKVVAVDEGLFYGNDRIYVVVACVTIILVGLLIYLFSLDRRLKKLEKNS